MCLCVYRLGKSFVKDDDDCNLCGAMKSFRVRFPKVRKELDTALPSEFPQVALTKAKKTRRRKSSQRDIEAKLTAQRQVRDASLEIPSHSELTKARRVLRKLKNRQKGAAWLIAGRSFASVTASGSYLATLCAGDVKRARRRTFLSK